METHVILALVITAASGTAFAANEWSHGGVSEAAGWGHHHMLNDSAYHCGVHAAMHDESMPHAHAPACQGAAP